MQSNAEAKKAAPPSEARIWTAALVGVAIAYFMGILFDIYMGSDPHAMIPRRASLAFGVLLGWGGYHLVNRRAYDIQALVGVAGAIVLPPPGRSILAGFLYGLSLTAFVLPIVGIVTRSHESAIGKAPDKKKAKPSRSGHPMFDSELDG